MGVSRGGNNEQLIILHNSDLFYKSDQLLSPGWQFILFSQIKSECVGLFLAFLFMLVDMLQGLLSHLL